MRSAPSAASSCSLAAACSLLRRDRRCDGHGLVVASGDAEATTAIQVVRRWQPDYNRLAAAAALVRAINERRVDLEAAEAELDRAEASAYRYPRWLGFAAPALLSMAVTILFGGRVGDALVTLGIGLAIQPVWKASSAAG